MRKEIMTLAALAALGAGPALAQSGTATGVAGGAATGAVVGGPVGAVVGGVVGGVVGTAIDPPPAEVRTYVVKEKTPSVTVKERVVVGEPLPETVVIRPVPRYETYSYAVVNDQRVIVEPKTRRVIEVVN